MLAVGDSLVAAASAFALGDDEACAEFVAMYRDARAAGAPEPVLFEGPDVQVIPYLERLLRHPSVARRPDAMIEHLARLLEAGR